MRKLKKVKMPSRVTYVRPALAGLLLLLSSLGWSQTRTNFSPGEEVTYGAYYNWHFLWVHAGMVTFSCDTIQEQGETQWLLKATGHTYKTYDLMYSVRDTFETRLSYPDFEPIDFFRTVNHGSGSSQQYYHFQPEKGTVEYVYRSNEKADVDKTFAVQRGVLDLLSQSYAFRNYDYDHLQQDELVKFNMLMDDKVMEFYFRYKGTEEVKTRNKRTFLCHKVSVWLMEGDFFPEGEDMYVWFTADKNHIPIMVDTKIQVGSVKAIFLDAKNLTYPLKSEID